MCTDGDGGIYAFYNSIIEDEQPARERIGELVIQELSGETEVYIEKIRKTRSVFLKALEEKKRYSVSGRCNL